MATRPMGISGGDTSPHCCPQTWSVSVEGDACITEYIVFLIVHKEIKTRFLPQSLTNFNVFFYLLACYANNTDLVKKLSFVASDAEGTKHFFVFTNSDLKITFVFKWGKHLFIFDIMSSVDAAAQQSWSRRCDGPAAFFSSALADVSWLSGVPWTACSLQSAHICVGDGLRA